MTIRRRRRRRHQHHCQAAAKLGFKWSKPYALKLFDVKIRALLNFSDYDGICKLMVR